MTTIDIHTRRSDLLPTASFHRSTQYAWFTLNFPDGGDNVTAFTHDLAPEQLRSLASGLVGIAEALLGQALQKEGDAIGAGQI